MPGNDPISAILGNFESAKKGLEAIKELRSDMKIFMTIFESFNETTPKLIALFEKFNKSTPKMIKLLEKVTNFMEKGEQYLPKLLSVIEKMEGSMEGITKLVEVLLDEEK